MVLFLLLIWFTSSLPAHRWVSRYLPCDVNVRNNTTVSFDCSFRRLTEVPADVNMNATTLNLKGNQIQHISNTSFRNLKNLKVLTLNWKNKHKPGLTIAKDTFAALANLEILLLDGNLLTDIPTGFPPGLKVLSLNSNKIASIGSENFTGIPNVTEIRINRNCYYHNGCNDSLAIQNGTFSQLTHLLHLSLIFNRLARVPLDLPTSLQLLRLSLNKIEHVDHLDFQNLSELRMLDLSGNCPRCSNAPFPCETCETEKGAIKVHPLAFHNLTQLEELRLSGNSLFKLHASWFQNCPKLKYLYLSFNSLISEIATGEFLTVLPHVEVVDLSFNFDPKSYPSRMTLSPNFSQLLSLRTLHFEGYVFRNIEGNDLQPLFNLQNLSVLNFGTNFLQYVDLTLFQNFSNISLIYLSENRLASQSRRTNLSCSSENDAHHILSRPLLKDRAIDKRDQNYIVHKDGDYRLSLPFVKPKCLVYGPALDLSKNNIFYITPELFEGLKNLTCLNLSVNSIADSFNGTEFIHLPNLRYLDLSHNKIDLAYDYAFSELSYLEVLDISYNPHYFLVAGVIHNLGFLKHLHFLKVLNLSWNEIFTLSKDKEMSSESLNKLDFQGNRLDILWKDDKRYIGLFAKLVNLQYLDLSYNKLQNIPSAVYYNLPKNLTHLNLNNNKLKCFQWEHLINLWHLEVLDLSHNNLENVSEKLTNHTNSLIRLDLSYNKIAQLFDYFLQGARSLHFLYLNHNNLRLLNAHTFPSGPDTSLKVLSLKGNPFQCTCEIFDFKMWINKTDIEIPRLATDVTCASPENRKGMGIITFDLQECINDSTSAVLFLLSTLTIVLIITVAIMQHLFYWDVWYIFHYCKAKIKGYRYLASTDNIYNAFITYDTKDPVVTDWVFNHLRVQLEEKGEKFLPICLEERDWHPGAPVIDNLSQSIRQSRKTVFVLTERYVNSGNFRLAFYLAHQRLLDDNTDVIVLVLLEPVLQYSQFFRLRKRLCRKTILEWPKNPHAEDWFWQSLRNVIRLENQAMYNKLYSCYFTNK
ncbi:TLR8 protein, partial [Amia calva]|nr:TLR8 protein [Amia calva]